MKKRKIIIIVLLLCICCPFFSITLHADEKQITDTAKSEILKENRKNLDKNGIIYEDINFTDDYLIAKTIEKKEIDFDTTKLENTSQKNTKKTKRKKTRIAGIGWYCSCSLSGTLHRNCSACTYDFF